MSDLPCAAAFLPQAEDHSAAEPQFKIQDSKFKRIYREQFLLEPLRAAKKLANSSTARQSRNSRFKIPNSREYTESNSC
jgi:hypothetical protein